MKSLIAQAYAAAEVTTTPSLPGEPAAVPAAVPTTGGLMSMNMVMLVVLVILFYVLLVMPQQKRFKRHKEMVDTLKKGDRVLTAAGFIGTVDKIDSDKGEIVLDLGSGMKVTALRSSIQNKMSDAA